MKKLLFSIILAASPILCFSQIFQEDFDGNGPGIKAWTIIDVDGNIPNKYVSFITNGWNRVERFGPRGNYGGPPGNFVAMSTSWYVKPGTSNDWLISPEIKITEANAYLSWIAKANHISFRDGYKVMLSTNGKNSVKDFDITLFEINEEEVEWIERKVDLSSYNGKTIRFAFVNNSYHSNLLLIDDIIVDHFTPTREPDCTKLIFPVDKASGVEYAHNKFQWEAPEGIIFGYDFYLDGKFIKYTTEKHLTLDLDSETSYQWKVIAKNAIGESINCVESTFTTKVNLFAPYCGPLNFASIYGDNIEPISMVRFSNLENHTNPEKNESPGHEVFLDQIADVKIGESYGITVKGNTMPNGVSSLALFIDWDQNNLFDDSEVYILPDLENSTGIDDKESKYSITIPQNAKEGITRMRVKKINGKYKLHHPCEADNYGQAEDYSVRVANGLGVSESKISNLNVYPNPVKNILNIDSSFKVNSVSVYDLTGKLITSVLGIKKTTIDFSSLKTGIYILKVSTENGETQSIKIIKK